MSTQNDNEVAIAAIVAKVDRSNRQTRIRAVAKLFELGLSQRQMADLLDMAPSSVSDDMKWARQMHGPLNSPPTDRKPLKPLTRGRMGGRPRQELVKSWVGTLHQMMIKVRVLEDIADHDDRYRRRVRDLFHTRAEIEEAVAILQRVLADFDTSTRSTGEHSNDPHQQERESRAGATEAGTGYPAAEGAPVGRVKSGHHVHGSRREPRH